MHFPSEKDDWKTFEKNNVTTAPNILYCEKYILLMFQTKLKLLKTNYLLMIPNGKVWHYLAVKELLPLLKWITPWWFLLSELSSFFCRWEKNSNHIKKYVKIFNMRIFNVITPSEDTKVLEFNQCQRSDTAPFII